MDLPDVDDDADWVADVGRRQTVDAERHAGHHQHQRRHPVARLHHALIGGPTAQQAQYRYDEMARKVQSEINLISLERF